MLKPFKEYKNNIKLSQYISTYINSYNPRTFYTNGMLQCRDGARRSFTDMVDIVRAKFPNATKGEIYYNILIDKGNVRERLFIGFCFDVKKIVFKKFVPRTWPILIELDKKTEIFKFKLAKHYDSDIKNRYVDGESYSEIIKELNKYSKKLKKNIK